VYSGHKWQNGKISAETRLWLVLTELIAHQVLPQHSVLAVPVQYSQGGVPVLAVEVGISPRRRAGAQVVAEAF